MPIMEESHDTQAKKKISGETMEMKENHVIDNNSKNTNSVMNCSNDNNNNTISSNSSNNEFNSNIIDNNYNDHTNKRENTINSNNNIGKNDINEDSHMNNNSSSNNSNNINISSREELMEFETETDEEKMYEQVINTIRMIKKRKSRPDIERICKSMKRKHAVESDVTAALLESLCENEVSTFADPIRKSVNSTYQ